MNHQPGYRTTTDYFTRDCNDAERILTNAHRRLDIAGIEPADPHTPWTRWRLANAPTDTPSPTSNPTRQTNPT